MEPTRSPLVQVWRSIPLLALLLVLVLYLTTGTISLLLHPALHAWQWLCVLVLGLFAWVQLTHARLKTQSIPNWVLLVFLLPVILAAAAPPVPLGADVLDRQGYSFPRPVDPVSLVGRELPWLEDDRITVSDQVYYDAMMVLRHYPEQFRGYHIEMVGFTAPGRGLPPDQTLVARLVVTCHVGCAMPAGLYVQSEELAALGDNVWVQVSGRLMPGEIHGENVLVIDAPVFEQVADPPDLYIFLE